MLFFKGTGLLRHPIYFIHWAQNAQIRPVRFFSNFKCCGNFAVPTLDQIFRGGELPPLRGSAWGTSPFLPPQLYAYVYGYGWAMDVYCVHWVQNAQIRPVRFFSNFKSCGNFAVPTLDQIFRGGNFPPLRGSGGGTSPFSPPSCTPMVSFILLQMRAFGETKIR